MEGLHFYNYVLKAISFNCTSIGFAVNVHVTNTWKQKHWLKYGLSAPYMQQLSLPGAKLIILSS